MNTNKASELSSIFLVLVTLRLLLTVSCRPQNGSLLITSRGISCQQLSTRQLWIRLDQLSGSAQRQSGEPTTVPPAVVPIHEMRGLRHRKHSRRALRHFRHSGTAPDRRRATSRKNPRQQKNERKRQKSMRSRKKKFLKKLARIQNGNEVSRMLFSSESSWQCKFEEQWRHLGEDYFPEYVSTGRCVHSQCVLGFYQCAESTYHVSVLRRDKLNCHVIPTLGIDTVYEEAWIEDHVQVVVGCACVPYGKS